MTDSSSSSLLAGLADGLAPKSGATRNARFAPTTWVPRSPCPTGIQRMRLGIVATAPAGIAARSEHPAQSPEIAENRATDGPTNGPLRGRQAIDASGSRAPPAARAREHRRALNGGDRAGASPARAAGDRRGRSTGGVGRQATAVGRRRPAAWAPSDPPWAADRPASVGRQATGGAADRPASVGRAERPAAADRPRAGGLKRRGPATRGRPPSAGAGSPARSRRCESAVRSSVD